MVSQVDEGWLERVVKRREKTKRDWKKEELR